MNGCLRAGGAARRSGGARPPLALQKPASATGFFWRGRAFLSRMQVPVALTLGAAGRLPRRERMRKPLPGSAIPCEFERMTEITGTDALARVKEPVEDIDFTMLTTVDDEGNLVSRPMSTRQMDEAGDIWFFTSDDTDKVDEARAHRDVGLSY